MNLIKRIVRDHLRVTSLDDELYRNAMQCVKSALHAAEQYTNRVIISSDVAIRLFKFDGGVLELPTAPIEVNGVALYDFEGSEIPMFHEVIRSEKRAIVRITEPITFESASSGPKVVIHGQAGYYDEEYDVFSEDEDGGSYSMPGAIVQAVILIASMFFESSADTLGGNNSAELPASAKALLHPYRIYPYGEL